MLKNMLVYKVWAHLFTILKHKGYVFCYCCRAGLFWQGVIHDLSKFSIEEFVPGVKYYTGNCSPNSIQKYKEGYSSAWLHHKNRNKHHYEYWLDYFEQYYNEKGEKISPIEMPPRYLVEMFCDRVAACRVYRGKEYVDSDPLDYYIKQRERIIIHENTRMELERLLECLACYGEKKAFQNARKLLRKK